jgi:hypothetical protein
LRKIGAISFKENSGGQYLDEVAELRFGQVRAGEQTPSQVR